MELDQSLSQNEIDALLAILPTDGSPLAGGTFGIGPAKSYDFRSPDKFSKEQIRTLEMIHETFAKRASASLSAFVRTSVSIALGTIEQGTFVEFLQKMPHPGFFNVMSMAPLSGRLLMALDTDTATVAMDRMLGGVGRPAEPGHEITDIEQSLMHGVIRYFASALHEAWRNLIDLRFAIEETALTPEFLQVTSPTDAAVFIEFAVRIRDNVGSLGICIPYATLKPLMGRLSPHTWVAGESRDAGSHRETLLDHLRQVEVDISILLGEANVPFEDLLHLQDGDVLVLNSVPGRPLPILIESNRRYLGHPGLVNSTVAAQIFAVTEEKNNE